MAESLSKSLQAYGNSILSLKDSSKIPEPCFTVAAGDFLALLKSVKSDATSPQDVGLFCAARRGISDGWRSFSASDKENIKSSLLKASSSRMNKLVMGRFADAVIEAYKLSEYKWPELADFIFKATPKTEFHGFLFVRYCTTCNTAFYTQKALDIIMMISELIDGACTSVQTGLVVIFSNLNIQKALQQKPELYEAVWKAVLNVYTNDPERIRILSQALDAMFDKVPVLYDASPKAVVAAINNVKTDINSAKPLIQLICYLSLQNVKDLLAKIKAVKNAPVEIESALNDGPISEIPESITKELVPTLKNGKSDVEIAIYAPFAVANNDASILNEIMDDKKIPRVLVGLKAFEIFAKDNDEDEFVPDDEILGKTLLYLSHSNQEITTYAFAAMKSLIESDSFSQVDDCANLIAQFEKISESNRVHFFELLSALLKVEGIDDSIVDKVFDFAYLLIRNNSKYAIDCLHLFNVMFYSNERDELLTPVVDDLLPFAIQIIKNKESKGYVQALRAIALFVSLDDNIDKKKITPLFTQIFDIADHDKAPKNKAEAAVSLITIALKFKDESLFQRCYDYISVFSKSTELPLIRACAKIGHSLFDTKFAGPSLDALCQIALNTTDTAALNSLLRAIKNLMVVAKSQKVVTLLDALLSGSHPIYNHKNPSVFVDRETQIFKFIRHACDYIPEREPAIIETLIRRIHEVPISMFIVYLRAINKFDSIPTNLASILAKLLARSMDGSTPTIDEIVLDSLMKLIRNDKTVFNIDILASQMVYFWDKMEDEGGWRASVGCSILELTSMGAEVDDDVLTDVLADYPFANQVGRCEMASKSIVSIIDGPRNNTGIAPIIARCLADVLTLSVPKMRDLELTETTRNEMKRVIKKIFTQNKSILAEISKSFQEPERLKQRFQTLL